MHPDVCALHLGRVLRGAARAGPESRATRTTPARARACVSCRSSTRARRQESPEEVAAVAGSIVRRARRGAASRPDATIMVVAPYNAQVNAARDGACRTRVRVGTVDKFQGQEATSSSTRWPARAGRTFPRGLEFLLSRNRTERRDLARALPRVPGGEPAAARGELPHDRADAARERALSLRRARCLAGRTKAARRDCRRSLSCRSPQSLSKRRLRSTLRAFVHTFKPLWPLAPNHRSSRCREASVRGLAVAQTQPGGNARDRPHGRPNLRAPARRALSRSGLPEAEVVGRRGDYGADLVLVKGGRKTVVQAKCWRKKNVWHQGGTGGGRCARPLPRRRCDGCHQLVFHDERAEPRGFEQRDTLWAPRRC